MADTWINGYFFEYDEAALQKSSAKGIQYRIVTDLTLEPVDVPFFKAHSKVDFEMDDALIPTYIKAARQEIEKTYQITCGDKTMKLFALRLPKEYNLMYGPVKAVQTPANTFTLIGDIIKSTSEQKDIEVVYTVGWTGGLPEAIKIAICQRAAGLYMKRENIVTEIGYSMLLDQAKETMKQFRNPYFL